MTVERLIKELQKLDKNLIVCYDSEDGAIEITNLYTETNIEYYPEDGGYPKTTGNIVEFR